VIQAAALLDTDTLSLIMRSDQRVVPRAQAYLGVRRHLTISIITRYEVVRGLEAKQAWKQLAAFESLCTTMEVLPLSDGIVLRAAAIYGDLHRRGSLIGDADVLIAATAMEHGLILVTNNERQLRRIADLVLDNWAT
jgi:tRNA(fMet)-specific endonuclease VapC